MNEHEIVALLCSSAMADPCAKKSDVLITVREVEQMEREQRKYDNAHMKEKPFKLGGDMKDSLSLSSPPLPLFCFLLFSLPSSLLSSPHPSSLSNNCTFRLKL